MICAELVAQRAQRLEAIFSTLTGPSISINAVKRGAFSALEPVSENMCYLKASGASKQRIPKTESGFPQNVEIFQSF